MTRREYTAKEIEEVNGAEELLRAKGLDEGTERVVQIIDGYFQTNRSVPVTAEVIIKLIVSQLGLRWASAAELEYRRVASENLTAAQQLAGWLATQGKSGQLANEGDQFFENMTLLLTALRGYEINSTTIQHAEDRIAHQAGRQLHRVPQPRRTEPISPAALADEGKTNSRNWLGEHLNEPAWVRRSRERNERDAKLAADQPSETSLQAIAVREAQRKAEELRGNSHAESAQLHRILVTKPGTSEIDWVATYESRRQMQRQFEKHRAVSRFVR